MSKPHLHSGSAPVSFDLRELVGATISVAVEMISPEIARRYLATQQRNRKLRLRHIKALVRDMERGDFRFTAAAIAFDDQGYLIDGQHRLKAIEQSGVTVPVFVMRGFGAAVQDSMDLGAVRSVAEQMGMDGVKDPIRLVSYSNAISRGFVGYEGKLSIHQVKLILKALPMVPAAVSKDSPKLQYRSATYLGLIALALHLPGKSLDVARFYDAFTRGIGISGEESPAWRLREFARGATPFGGSNTRACAGYVADCLQAWIERQPMTTARPTGTGMSWLRAKLSKQYETLRGVLGFKTTP